MYLCIGLVRLRVAVFVYIALCLSFIVNTRGTNERIQITITGPNYQISTFLPRSPCHNNVSSTDNQIRYTMLPQTAIDTCIFIKVKLKDPLYDLGKLDVCCWHTIILYTSWHTILWTSWHTIILYTSWCIIILYTSWHTLIFIPYDTP